MAPRDDIYNIIENLINSGIDPHLDRVKEIYYLSGGKKISDEQFELIYDSFLGDDIRIRGGLDYIKFYKFDDLLKGSKIRFGAVSDTHIGSKYHDNKFLHEVYDWFEEEGVDTVFHCGDILDGYGVYHGQQNTLSEVNIGEQARMCADIYPRKKDITTYFITGNHDLKQFEKASGIDPGLIIEKERDDLKYLGQYAAEIDVRGITVRMVHLSGGSTYAKSYPIQKYLRDLPPQMIPNVLLLGHLHDYNETLYRGCYSILMPSFLRPNELAIRKGFSSYIGGLIIDIGVSSDGNIVSFSSSLRIKEYIEGITDREERIRRINETKERLSK